MCVCTIWIDVKPLCYAGACGTHVLPHATKLWTWVGWETWPVSCTCILIYCIVPPLGAYKSQLGGTYNLSLLFYIFNVSCDPIYIYFFFSHLFMFSVCCLLHDRDTPHQNSRRCFDSSVYLMSKSTRWHEPHEGTLRERIDPPIWLWIYTFIVGNSSK